MATKGKAAVKAAAEVAALVPQQGGKIKFLGYSADVPENEQWLVIDEEYEIYEISAEDNSLQVLMANPDFDPKKKPHAETNPSEMLVQAYPGEFEVVAEATVEGEAETVAEVPEEVAPEVAPEVADTPVKKTAAPVKQAAKTTAPAAKTAGKPAAKTAKAKAAPAEEALPAEVDGPALPDLENEDEAILALVAGSEDLIATAQDLESSVSQTEYQLGAMLYHIKKEKLHLAVEGGQEYDVKGGFALFLTQYFNLDYRKAMYLIEIYVYFTLAAIPDASLRVSELGWTKAQKIAKLLNEEGTNKEELLTLAASSTVADLSSAIKEQVTVGAKKTGGTEMTRLTLKFRLFENDAQTADTILKAAKDALGLETLDQTLMVILNAWSENNVPAIAETAAVPTQGKAVGAPARKSAKKVAA